MNVPFEKVESPYFTYVVMDKQYLNVMSMSFIMSNSVKQTEMSCLDLNVKRFTTTHDTEF